MYAYCNNNPVMYVDSEGNLPGLIWGLVALGALLIVALTSCSDPSPAEPDTPKSLLEEETKYDKTPSQITRDQDLYIEVNITNTNNWLDDNEKIKQYTNLLADDIESRYGMYLNGNKIERDQLHAEIKFHIAFWDSGLVTKRANPINLQITSVGAVVDEDIGGLADFFYGDDYYE